MNRFIVCAFLLLSCVVYAFSAPTSSNPINNSGFYITNIDSLSNGKWMLTGMNGSIYTSSSIKSTFAKKITLTDAAAYRKVAVGNDWLLNIMLPNTIVTKFVRYHSDVDTVELIETVNNKVYSSVTSQGSKIFASGCELVGAAIKGVIAYSTDEGRSWHTAFQTAHAKIIMGIVAKGNDTLIACGSNGYLAYSFDKGATWNEDYIGLNVDLTQVSFLGNRTLITSENEGIFYFDEDIQKWIHLQLKCPISSDISIGLSGDKLYIVSNNSGTKGVIFEYDFATKQDNLLYTSPDEAFSALYINSPEKFYIGTQSGNILEVSDFTSAVDTDNRPNKLLKANMADRGATMYVSVGAEASAGNYDWCIFDVLGNAISNGTSATAEFSVTAPNTSGKYFLRIRSANGTTAEGFLVR